MKYKVKRSLIYGGKVVKEGEILENLTADEKKRMLENEWVEEYKDVKPEPEPEPEPEVVEIEIHTIEELKAFDRTKLFEIAKELDLNAPANIGTDTLITKILNEYENIEKED